MIPALLVVGALVYLAYKYGQAIELLRILEREPLAAPHSAEGRAENDGATNRLKDPSSRSEVYDQEAELRLVKS